MREAGGGTQAQQVLMGEVCACEQAVYAHGPIVDVAWGYLPQGTPVRRVDVYQLSPRDEEGRVSFEALVECQDGARHWRPFWAHTLQNTLRALGL